VECTWKPVEGALNNEMDLQKMGFGNIDWIVLAQYMERSGTCNCRRELSNSIKCREFLD
jgi:hypothetical protein